MTAQLTRTLPTFEIANVHAVTPQLWVGGDLDLDTQTALEQLLELTDAGLTHIADVRLEASDEVLVAEFGEHRDIEIGYLHHGVDDRGQRIPASWFETGVRFALEAIEAGGVVLTHCHMGINRGPSLGYAVLLAQGWDPVDAIDAVRRARPIAHMDYADDALAWYHERNGGTDADLRRESNRVAAWRCVNHLDVVQVIRKIRSAEARR